MEHFSESKTNIEIIFQIFSFELIWCYECDSYMQLKKVEEIHEDGALCDECDESIEAGYFWHCPNVKQK